MTVVEWINLTEQEPTSVENLRGRPGPRVGPLRFSQSIQSPTEAAYAGANEE
jgi:hypothetical protein